MTKAKAVTKIDPLAPPKHLRKETQAWISSILTEYALESHHLRLLILAAEAWDRGTQAREALVKHGTTFTDRFGQPRSRPEIAIERDSRVSFARLIRELQLDITEPGDSRPPIMTGKHSLKKEN